MRKITFASFLSFILVSVFSCASSTRFTGSWKKPDFPNTKQYQKVFVVALTENQAARTLVEDELAYYARKQGADAVKSYKVFPPTFSKTSPPAKEALLEVIRSTGSDIIFTVSLLEQSNKSRYVPGNMSYPAYYPLRFSYYGQFYGYYNAMYPITYETGYYTTDRIYYLESNLYDSQTEELLWSAQSKTVNPSNLENFVHSYSQSLLKKLVKDGIIKEPAS